MLSDDNELRYELRYEQLSRVVEMINAFIRFWFEAVMECSV